jgi:hypothetical protein
MAYRSTWFDVNPNWVDYLEARVEALVGEINRLQNEIKELEKNELAQAMPSVLVRGLSVQEPAGAQMPIQVTR